MLTLSQVHATTKRKGCIYVVETDTLLTKGQYLGLKKLRDIDEVCFISTQRLDNPLLQWALSICPTKATSVQLKAFGRHQVKERLLNELRTQIKQKPFADFCLVSPDKGYELMTETLSHNRFYQIPMFRD